MFCLFILQVMDLDCFPLLAVKSSAICTFMNKYLYGCMFFIS